MTNQIHPTAIVSPKAELNGVEIGPYVIIEDDVQMDSGNQILSGATIKSGSRIGKNNIFHEHCVIGGLPQDLAFSPDTPTYVTIGDDNTIREGATIHRATVEGTSTIVENKTYLMGYAHMAHDTHIENEVILANNSILAGFAVVGAKTFVSGHVGIHQFTKVGRHVMVGAGTIITKDVPPFTKIYGSPARCSGLNTVGLQRSGFSEEDIQEIEESYKTLFQPSTSIPERLETLQHRNSPLAQEILSFCQNSKRGLIPPK